MTYANNNDGLTNVFYVYPIQLTANIFDQFHQASPQRYHIISISQNQYFFEFEK